MRDPSFERLTSARLVVRRFALDDAETFAAYRSDPAVARYQAWDCPYPVGEARRFIASLARAAPGTPGTWFQFAVSLAESGALVGDVALRTGEDGREGEIGFTFAVVHQGRGYATEAVRTVVRYAFQRLAIQRLFSRTDARNAPAQRLLERLGFRREDELRESVWLEGAWATELVYSLREPERKTAW